MRWAALALALLTASPAWAQEVKQDRSESFFAEVKAGYGEYAFSGSPTPVWVTLQNPTNEQVQLRLVARSRKSRSERSVVLPPGARQRVFLALEIYQRRLLLRLMDGGQVVEELIIEGLKHVSGDRHLLCIDGRPRGHDAPSRMNDSTLPFVTISPRNAPTESICYRPFGAVLLREADPDAWGQEQRRALDEHVAQGGTLIVTGVTPQRPKCVSFVESFLAPPELIRLFSRPAQIRRLGLGQVLAFPDDMLGSAYRNTPKSAQLKQDLGNAIKEWRKGNGFALLFQGGAHHPFSTRPGGATKVLVGLFALAYLLAVGPVLAIFLRKSSRRRLAIVTLVLIGVFSGLAVVVAGVVRTGTGKAYVREVLYVPTQGPALHLADVTVVSGGATSYDLSLHGLDLAATTLPVGATRSQEWNNGIWAWDELRALSTQTHRGSKVDLRLSMAPWDEQSVSTVAIVPNVQPLDATLRLGPKGYVVRVVNTTPTTLHSALLIEENAPVEFSTPYVDLGDLAPGASKEVVIKSGRVQMNIYDERQTWYRMLGVPGGWETWGEVVSPHTTLGALRYRVVSRVEPLLTVVGNRLESAPYALRIDPVVVQGGVAHGFMGISVVAGSRSSVGYSGMREQVRVKRVMSRGPAKKAGMTAGLIIKSINNQNITSVRQFRGVISRYLPGERIRVRCSDPQTGRQRKFSIKLVERDQIRD